MRYPAWTEEEDKVLFGRWFDMMNYPTSTAVATNFPSRSASGVHSRIKKLIDAGDLSPREKREVEKEDVAEPPTRPVLVAKRSNIALPDIRCLRGNKKYSSGRVVQRQA